MGSVTNNELCKECQLLVSKISCEPGLGMHYHHPTLESLEESSKDVCGICAELLRSLRDEFISETTNSLASCFPIICEFDTSSASWQSSFELVFKLDKRRIYFSLRFVLEVQSEATEYSPASSTDSPQSWELIDRWLNQCIHKHDRCNLSATEHWVPTRLLDIGTSEDSLIRLLDRDETRLLSKVSYATLSHCWGMASFINTTSRNLQSHHHEIPREILPLTFKDAIKVARNLHIHYLWIDSLCIVQDSMEDWTHEANLMSKVYTCSFINIAATGSKDSKDGCFWKRDKRTVLPTEVYIQWRNSWSDRNQEVRRIKYRVVLEADHWTRKLLDEPLNQRCWVLQERILPPRVLHFGREQLFWECQEFFACETYHHGLPTALQSHPLINIKRIKLENDPRYHRWPTNYISGIPKEASFVRKLWYDFTTMFRPNVIQQTTLYTAMNSESIYQNWYAILELYSMGKLSFAKDKLVALSGIAQTIMTVESDRHGDGYLAGLWQSSLPASLLWRPTNTKISHRTNRHGRADVPFRYADTSDYIAPTWSWASLDGQISFTSCQANWRPEDYLARMEDARVSYDDRFRFGQVTSGFVKLSGPVASALWEIKDEYPPPDNVSKLMIISHMFPPHLTRRASVRINTDRPHDGEIFLDEVMEDIPKELTLLCIIGHQGRDGRIHIAEGLVLQRSNHDEEYTRIGGFSILHNQKRRILMNMPRQSVIIK